MTMTTTRDDLVALVRDGTKYRQNRSRWERFWIYFITALILAPLNGWMLMFAIGVAHHHWWPAVPTIGYWWAVLLACLLRSALTSTSTDTPAR
jgi:succinate dehydrogenase hydrophobic anchor subunit